MESGQNLSVYRSLFAKYGSNTTNRSKYMFNMYNTAEFHYFHMCFRIPLHKAKVIYLSIHHLRTYIAIIWPSIIILFWLRLQFIMGVFCWSHNKNSILTPTNKLHMYICNLFFIKKSTPPCFGAGQHTLRAASSMSQRETPLVRWLMQFRFFFTGYYRVVLCGYIHINYVCLFNNTSTSWWVGLDCAPNTPHKRRGIQMRKFDAIHMVEWIVLTCLWGYWARQREREREKAIITYAIMVWKLFGM